MKKMERFQVIDYGFKPAPQDDERLTLEGNDFNDFNDYFSGTGQSRKEALQFAIELIEEHGVQASKGLVKEMENSDTQTDDNEMYNVAVRFYFDRSAEDAEAEANLMGLIEGRRAEKQAIIEAGGFPEDMVTA